MKCKIWRFINMIYWRSYFMMMEIVHQYFREQEIRTKQFFNNIESNEVNWIDRGNNLVLTNSHRLSSKIANVVKSFALNNPNNFDIIGLNECDIKPHIILFDDTSKEKVIPKFVELVKELKEEGRLIDYGKYPIKVICLLLRCFV